VLPARFFCRRWLLPSPSRRVFFFGAPRPPVDPPTPDADTGFPLHEDGGLLRSFAIAVTAPSLAEFPDRPLKRAGDGMVPLRELEENPVALNIASAGESTTVSVERGASGKVRLTCSCSDSVADGWCRHGIDLLVARYDAVGEASPKSLQAFTAIVAGTRLGDMGLAADRALGIFNSCVAAFDEGRPADIAGGGLGEFTDLVSDLAASAAELEDRLSTLKRFLAQA
jgi:hypothetical protein